MGLLEGLIAGQKMAEFQATLAQRQEEARLHAQLFGSQAKHYDAQTKLIEHNLAKAQALSQRLRDVMTSSTAGTPQASTPPAPAEARTTAAVEDDVPPQPTSDPQSGTVGIDPTAAQLQRGFVQRYGPAANDQTQLEQFVQRYGPQAQPQGETAPELAPGPGLNPGGPAPAPPGDTPGVNLPGRTRDRRPAAVLEAPTGSGATAAAPDAPRPSAAERLSATAAAPPPGTPATLSQDDDAMLRSLAKAYFVHERPDLGLRIWGYADQQRKLREAATFYRNLLQHPQVDEDTRRGALAGLGGLMIQAGQADVGLKVLTPYLPLTVRQMIEKTSVSTRNILLEQMERGEQPSIGRANQEAAQRRKAKR
jgi:hypothetical protein